jgi:hypothetical protein
MMPILRSAEAISNRHSSVIALPRSRKTVKLSPRHRRYRTGVPRPILRPSSDVCIPFFPRTGGIFCPKVLTSFPSGNRRAAISEEDVYFSEVY